MSTWGAASKFADALGADDFHDRAIEWMKENLNPDDVFSEDDLKEWATSNDFVATDDLAEAVADEGLEVGDVFSNEDLVDWIVENVDVVTLLATLKKQD